MAQTSILFESHNDRFNIISQEFLKPVDKWHELFQKFRRKIRSKSTKNDVATCIAIIEQALKNSAEELMIDVRKGDNRVTRDVSLIFYFKNDEDEEKFDIKIKEK